MIMNMSREILRVYAVEKEFDRVKADEGAWRCSATTIDSAEEGAWQ
jgi:hypothetical protein